MSLTFDAEPHIYRWNGAIVPSVTQALQVAGIIPPYNGPEFYSIRGTEVHKACEYLDTGQLDEQDIETLDQALRPFVWSYWKWRLAVKPTYIAVEKEFYCETGQFAGRLDQMVEMDGNYILDRKTCAPKWYHGHQLALYALGVGVSLRAGLYLQADGSAAVLKPYADTRDVIEGLAAVTIWHARAKHTRGGNPKTGECEE